MVAGYLATWPGRWFTLCRWFILPRDLVAGLPCRGRCFTLPSDLVIGLSCRVACLLVFLAAWPARWFTLPRDLDVGLSCPGDLPLWPEIPSFTLGIVTNHQLDLTASDQWPMVPSRFTWIQNPLTQCLPGYVHWVPSTLQGPALSVLVTYSSWFTLAQFYQAKILTCMSLFHLVPCWGQ